MLERMLDRLVKLRGLYAMDEDKLIEIAQLQAMYCEATAKLSCVNEGIITLLLEDDA